MDLFGKTRKKISYSSRACPALAQFDLRAKSALLGCVGDGPQAFRASFDCLNIEFSRLNDVG